MTCSSRLFGLGRYIHTKKKPNLTNRWNGDVKSRDRAIRDKMRNFFDVSCSKKCRQKVMYEIFAIQQCFNSANSDEDDVVEIPIERLRRAKLDVNDMFMPVRGRRTKPASDIRAEKKAPLDLLKNDFFMPNRGRRDFPKVVATPLDYYSVKRNGIDLNSKDYFMPNRGRRQPSIDSILSENFFPQRGKKSTSAPAMVIEMPPWLVPSRPRVVDRNMIDLLGDLNQFLDEVSICKIPKIPTRPYHWWWEFTDGSWQTAKAAQEKKQIFSVLLCAALPCLSMSIHFHLRITEECEMN